MAVITRQHDANIEAGQTIVANDLDDELDSLVNEANSKNTRLNDLESNAMTISGVKTFGDGIKTDTISEETTDNGTDVEGVLCKDGYINILIAADPGTPAEGDVWYDNAADKLQYRDASTSQTIATSADVNGVTAPRHYMRVAYPVYATAATFTIGEGAAKSQSNDNFLEVTSSKTINLGTTGANGIAQSSNLTGTVSSASTTITGSSTTFLTDYQVGDIITANSESVRITAVTNDTTMTVATAPSPAWSADTHQRGGEAASTWYHLYILDDATTPAYILSTRDVSGGDTLTDLPAGYTVGSHSRQLPYSFYNDSSSDLIPFFCDGIGVVRYRVNFQPSEHGAGGTNVLDGGQATTYTNVDLTSFVPPTSRSVIIRAGVHRVSNDGKNAYVRKDGASADEWEFEAHSGKHNSDETVTVECSTAQLIEYKVDDTTIGLDLAVVGYTVTEVL